MVGDAVRPAQAMMVGRPDERDLMLFLRAMAGDGWAFFFQKPDARDLEM
jgi:hypothetical protein